MTTIIEMPGIREMQKVVYNPKVKHPKQDHVEVLRIVTDEAELTRIDFIYRAPQYYINGGWVQMSRHCFIRPCGTNSQLTLVKAVNIPLAPVKHYFRKCGDILCYTLYFPPLPRGTQSIDIIEAEDPGGNWFNFYGVSIERIRSEKLIVNSN